jgi:hypothetical protein
MTQRNTEKYHLGVLGQKTPPRRGLEQVSLANMFAVVEKIHREELCDTLRLLCALCVRVFQRPPSVF